MIVDGFVIVRGERIQSLWSGYGEIYRARLDGRPVVVKSVRPPPDAHPRKIRSYDVELEWYRRYRSPSRVAELICGSATDEGWTFVLEDLDAAGFSRRRGELDPCLSWLARFHVHFLGVEPAGLWPIGTYWHLDTRRDELAVVDPELRHAAPILDQRLRTCRFQTIVHGDSKTANFCFGQDGVAAVDFQYVGGGVGVSDVAYLISGSSDEQRMLDRYFEHLRAAGGSAELEREWRALYPIAAADFYRFYAGWAPSQWRHERHGQQVMREVLRTL